MVRTISLSSKGISVKFLAVDCTWVGKLYMCCVLIRLAAELRSALEKGAALQPRVPTFSVGRYALLRCRDETGFRFGGPTGVCGAL